MRRMGGPKPVVPGLVLVALLGAWIGHTLEYARLHGIAGVDDALASSVHVYMLPVGAVLASLAGAGAVRCWRLWLSLGRRLDEARALLSGCWRGRLSASTPPALDPGPSAGARWLALSIVLAVLQVGLYVVQENLESLLAGLPAPGLSPLTGGHAGAPLVHAGVALLLASVLCGVWRGLRARTRRIEACERLVRILRTRLARSAPARRRAAWCPSPVERFGGELWSRPPPAPIAAR